MANDEVLDVDHADYARTCCIDIPGPRPMTENSRQWNVFIIAANPYATKTEGLLNIGFIVGQTVISSFSTTNSRPSLPVERSVSPMLYW